MSWQRAFFWLQMQISVDSTCSLPCLILLCMRWILSISSFIVLRRLMQKHMPQGPSHYWLVVCITLAQISFLSSIAPAFLPRQNVYSAVSNSVALASFCMNIYMPSTYFGYQLGVLLDRQMSYSILKMAMILPITMGIISASLLIDDELWNLFKGANPLSLDPMPDGPILIGYVFSNRSLITEICMDVLLNIFEAALFIKGTNILRSDAQRFRAIIIIAMSFLFESAMNATGGILGIIGGNVPIILASIVGDVTALVVISMPACIKESKWLDALLNSFLKWTLTSLSTRATADKVHMESSGQMNTTTLAIAATRFH